MVTQNFLFSLHLIAISHFRFIKHWFRGRNTCSRCDFEFQPYADSRLAQKREEKLRKISGSSSVQSIRTVKEEQKEDLTRERDLDREDRDHIDDKSLVGS